MARLNARRIYHDTQQTIIAIDYVEILYEKYAFRLGVLARLEPMAIVVSTFEHTYALDIDANPLDLDQLLQEVDNLNDMLF